MAKKTAKLKMSFAKSETQALKASIFMDKQGGVLSISTANTYRGCLKVFCDYIKERRLGDLMHATRVSATRFLESRSGEIEQKKLDQYKQAIQCFLRCTGALGKDEKLENIKSTLVTKLEHRAYTHEQVRLVMEHQRPNAALSTELALRCGLRAHEIYTLERRSEKDPDKRFYPGTNIEKNLPSKFSGMGAGERYIVTGKGGLVREVFLPSDLAKKVEQHRLPEPRKITDRGIYYTQKYDLVGGQRLSSSFTSASKRVLGWSTGLHGARHSYAQDRLRELTKKYSYDTAKETVSQELGHFRADITDAYLR